MPANDFSLKEGDYGSEVKTLQEQLQLTGFCDCVYYGTNNFTDGSFGSITKKYLMLMQKSAGINIDGEYGKQSQAALAKYVSSATNTKVDFNVTKFLSAAKSVANNNKSNGFTYGNATCLPSVNCDDKVTSCDRFVCQVLWSCGLKDCGNRSVHQVGEYLKTKGSSKITDKNKVKAGDIVFFSGHVFILGNKISDGIYERYDSGSKERIQLTGSYSSYKSQPFKEGIDGFVYAYRLPFCVEQKVETNNNTDSDSSEYTFSPENVQLGSTGNSVLLCQEILKSRGYVGANKYELLLDGDAGANTIFAINTYQSIRRADGVELGNNGKNTGVCNQKMWKDLIAI